MSSRRAPLTSNPNAANSPLRGLSTLNGFAKTQKRSYACAQREELYGQPPVKKQALQSGTQKVQRSPSATSRSTAPQLANTRLVARDRSNKAGAASRTAHDGENAREAWKKHHRAKFPKMVFYFESIPDDIRARLTRRVTYLGARQEPFFSIEVTHVVTTRSIPPEPSEAHDQDVTEHEDSEADQQPQTINPSLLDRSQPVVVARRKLFEFHGPSLRPQALDSSRLKKGVKNNDVLHKAREMGKKIWSLEKFQTMLSVLLESETAQGSSASRAQNASGTYGASKGSNEKNLLQLLHNERINGPSDRDPTASNRELVYFKGPYIYVWDMDEKQKPMVIREYPRVANKVDGEWPQFRSVGNGRCPFVEAEPSTKDHRKAREQDKARSARRQESLQVRKAPEATAPKAEAGKRTLTEMEDGHNRTRSTEATVVVLNPAKAALTKQVEARQQNAFTSRAEAGRVFAGEPVASGMQPSNVTSAIRSQMISSATGIHGAKAGTSKEMHGLQRKVLQKAAPASQDAPSCRRVCEASLEVASSRSTNTSRQTCKTVTAPEDDSQRAPDGKDKNSRSQPLKNRRDMKPGYCENCQDKFRDFDEHIVTRKHRKFAENQDNWTELDALLCQLTRITKYASMDDDGADWE